MRFVRVSCVCVCGKGALLMNKSWCLHFSKVGNRGRKLEGICFLLCAEAESVEGNIGELQLLSIVNGVYLDLSLRKAATKKIK